MTHRTFSSLAVVVFCSFAFVTYAETVRLDELDVAKIANGWGAAKRNRSIRDKSLSIGGVGFEHGVGVHAPEEAWIDLDGKAREFRAEVGVDDSAGGPGSVEFLVKIGDKVLWRSGVCRPGEKPRSCKVSLKGLRHIELIVTDGGDTIDFDHGDWADAVFDYDGKPPVLIERPIPVVQGEILTPKAPETPRINGPRVYGVRPGSPFLYRIPATGLRPMTFSAKGLPGGLTLHSKTGIITGSIAERAEYKVTLVATNGKGEDQREFRIVVGDTLALTPPMGWNSWYIFQRRVSDKAVREAADQMIASGMADYGYQYVNIDDCWSVRAREDGSQRRDPQGRILCNERFPDMSALTKYIHQKGLKAGLYTSPGPLTCAGYEGSYGHEALDAQTFAEWGFDFLKYDWCSYSRVAGGKTEEDYKKPYKIMRDLLQQQNRDVVFNLCQYGMGEVWKWGGEFGNCWRTTGDLGAQRGGRRLPNFVRIGLSNASHWEYAHFGAWNDPDYIMIGRIGTGGPGNSIPTTLTPDEQYSYMSMWCLMAAPLIYSGDITALDPFTLNVLCNHEVIDVDQDPLGKQGRVVMHSETEILMVKKMDDGSKVLGIFNFSETSKEMNVAWEDVGLNGKQKARDLWRQKDLGVFQSLVKRQVPAHGVALLRLWNAD